MNKMLVIAEIKRDLLLQPRAELHRDWIEDYAHDMTGGAKFPPIVVFFDGTHYWLGDGFHRSYAAEAAGHTKIAADVRKGTRRDALLHSCSANAEHGHRRSNDDKRRAIDILLNDETWVRWSDNEIAKRCGVANHTVSARRKAILENFQDRSRLRFVSRRGTTYEMDVGNIGPQPMYETAVDIEQEAAAHVADEPFDWAAAKLRSTAMDAIRILAALPSAPEVMAAWMKANSYGEEVATLERALAWLDAFLALYRVGEPKRWARVQMTTEIQNAAE